MDIFRNNKSKADEVERLKRAVAELSVLNDLATAISLSKDSDEIIRTIVGRSVKAVHAEEVSITLIDPSETDLGNTLVFTPLNDSGDVHHHLNRDIKGCMLHEKRALLVNDPATDALARNWKIPPGIRNFLCVPLMVRADVIGVLTAFNKIDGIFSPDDQRLLAIIATQSAQVMEKARLDSVTVAMQEEVRMAELIQSALLPKSSPEIPGFDLAGASRAAGQVGGDYFDFIPLPDHRWGLAVGDVSGKGVPAALLMANLQATLRSLVLQGTSCHRCMTSCNQLLYLSTTADRFATLFFGRLDIRSNVMTYCNAGHEHPFHISSEGQVRRLGSGGLAVGILDHFDYKDDIVIMQPGDLVAIFSDGVTDMIDTSDEPFGERRLEKTLLENRNLPAKDLVDLIIAEVSRHAGNEPAFDDVTLMIIKKDS